MDAVYFDKEVVMFPTPDSAGPFETSTTLRATNGSLLRLAFKVTTPDEKTFAASPKVGVIPGSGSITIQINLSSKSLSLDSIARGKIKVQVTEAHLLSDEDISGGDWHVEENGLDVKDFEFDIALVLSSRKSLGEAVLTPEASCDVSTEKYGSGVEGVHDEVNLTTQPKRSLSTFIGTRLKRTASFWKKKGTRARSPDPDLEDQAIDAVADRFVTEEDEEIAEVQLSPRQDTLMSVLPPSPKREKAESVRLVTVSKLDTHFAIPSPKPEPDDRPNGVIAWDELIVTNVSDERIAVKMKTTNIKQYIVLPNKLMMDAGETIPLRIYVGKTSYTSKPSKDRFLLKAARLPESISDSSLSDVWKQEDKMFDFQKIKININLDESVFRVWDGKPPVQKPKVSFLIPERDDEPPPANEYSGSHSESQSEMSMSMSMSMSMYELAKMGRVGKKDDQGLIEVNSDRLQMHVDPDGKGLVWGVLRIKNVTQTSVVFKILTTNLRHYIVRPNLGMIAAGHSVLAKIAFKPAVGGNVAPGMSKDKFMVETAKAPGFRATSLDKIKDFLSLQREVGRIKLRVEFIDGRSKTEAPI